MDNDTGFPEIVRLSGIHLGERRTQVLLYMKYMIPNIIDVNMQVLCPRHMCILLGETSSLASF